MIIRRIESIQLYEDFGRHYPLRKISRDNCGLVMGLPGSESDVYLDGKKYEFREGDVVFFREGERYDVKLPSNHMKCYVFNFYASAMDDFFYVRGCADLTESFAKAHQLWMRRREDEYFRDDCMAILYRLLAELHRRYDRGRLPFRMQERLKPLLEILHNEYQNADFRISELSERAGYSERYISRMFREYCGMSPKQYLTDLRFRYARELLSGDYSSIADIAIKAGFADASHFSESFRRSFGMTPGEYRRKAESEE